MNYRQMLSYKSGINSQNCAIWQGGLNYLWLIFCCKLQYILAMNSKGSKSKEKSSQYSGRHRPNFFQTVRDEPGGKRSIGKQVFLPKNDYEEFDARHQIRNIQAPPLPAVSRTNQSSQIQGIDFKQKDKQQIQRNERQKRNREGEGWWKDQKYQQIPKKVRSCVAGQQSLNKFQNAMFGWSRQSSVNQNGYKQTFLQKQSITKIQQRRYIPNEDSCYSGYSGQTPDPKYQQILRLQKELEKTQAKEQYTKHQLERAEINWHKSCEALNQAKKSNSSDVEQLKRDKIDCAEMIKSCNQRLNEYVKQIGYLNRVLIQLRTKTGK